MVRLGFFRRPDPECNRAFIIRSSSFPGHGPPPFSMRGNIMRDDLDAAITLYEGMKEEGRRHWRARAVPSIKFESEEEQRLFLEDLDRLDRGEEPVN